MKYEMKNISKSVHPADSPSVEQNKYSLNSNTYIDKNENPYNGIINEGTNEGYSKGGINENTTCQNYNHEFDETDSREKEVCEEVLNCHYCNKHVNPIVKRYTPFFVYIIIICLFLFISVFTIFVLPIIFLTFKQKRYICPFCNRNLTSTEKLFTIKREDKILIFQCAKCAIIVSIKYLILFFLLIVLIFFFYIIRRSTNFNLDFLGRGPMINTSWLDFLEDCGNKSQFRNKFNSINNFKNKYYGNTVTWRGHFHHIKEGFFNTNSLYIKMVPSEYKYDRPDMQIFFNNSLISKVENLEKNDYVEFECTLLEISKNKKPHLCLLWDLKLIEKYTPKNFTVIEFFKPLSVFDLINLHVANPFFINLEERNNTGKKVEIINMPNNNLHEIGHFQNDPELPIDILNHEMHTMGGRVEHFGRIEVELEGGNPNEKVFVSKMERSYKTNGGNTINGRDDAAVKHLEEYFFGYDDQREGEGEEEEEEEEGDEVINRDREEKEEEDEEEGKEEEEENSKANLKEEKKKNRYGDMDEAELEKQIQHQQNTGEKENEKTEGVGEEKEQSRDKDNFQIHIEAEELLKNIETETGNQYDKIIEKEKG